MAEGNPAAADAFIVGDAWADKVRQHRRKGIEWQTWRVPVSNPATSADDLTIIAGTIFPGDGVRSRQRGGSVSGVCVLEALASHPNTPPSLLAQIVQNAPTTSRAFCANPITPLLLLEMPDFLLTLSSDGKRTLLREETIPPIFLKLIAQEPKHLFAARLHVAWAEDGTTNAVVEGWQTEVRRYWQETCAHACLRERQWHTDLVELGLAPLWAAGGNPSPLPPSPCRYPLLDEWFRFMYADGSPEEAAMLEQIGPDTKNKTGLARGLRARADPADLIQVVQTARNRRGLVMQAVFRHPNTNAQVVEALANAKNSVPLRDLAQHEQASTHLLNDLLQKGDPNLRRLVRCHPNAPQDAAEVSRRAVMLQTRQDEEFVHLPFVSFVASLNFGNLRSGDALVQKAESLQWTQRLEAALIAGMNPNALHGDFAGRTSDDLLHHLSRDGNRLVRAAAKTYLADPNFRFVL